MSLHYIIDGYNLLNHKLFAQASVFPKDKAAAILGFIRRSRLTGSAKNKVVIVFDGYPNPSFQNIDSLGAEVIFSRKISADEKIKKTVEESADRKNIIVISDDKEIKFSVRSLGAKCLGIADFSLKEKKGPRKTEELLEAELNFSQKHKINEELKKLWLK